VTDPTSLVLVANAADASISSFRFDGEDGEIDVAQPGGGQHKAEFDHWRWEKLDALPGLIIPFKRGVYEQVAATFRPFAHPV